MVIFSWVSVRLIFKWSWRWMWSFRGFWFWLHSWRHILWSSRFLWQVVRKYANLFLHVTPFWLSDVSTHRNDLRSYFRKNTFPLFDEMKPFQVEVRFFNIKVHNYLVGISLPNYPTDSCTPPPLSSIILYWFGFWLTTEDKVTEKQMHPCHMNRIAWLLMLLFQFHL